MKPGFLVDGLTEQKFIQAACNNRPVKIINCNGSTVSVSAIAKRAASLIRLWGGKCFPIVVVVDRETREESASSFCLSLVNAIREEGIQDQLIVGVADQMIENWMLGDPDRWPNEAAIDNVDGFRGSSEVKRRLAGYDKAANGPGLLLSCRASELRKRSPSFRALFDQLATLKCNWLRN